MAVYYAPRSPGFFEQILPLAATVLKPELAAAFRGVLGLGGAPAQGVNPWAVNLNRAGGLDAIGSSVGTSSDIVPWQRNWNNPIGRW